jgi:two-component system NtrC family response regulator
MEIEMIPKILIIDDDDLICKSLTKVIKRFNYETDFCMDAEKAIDKVESSNPDIILLDIYLTTMSGLDILKELQIKYPYIPVIMITAFADVNIAVEAMKLGAFDFLLKPIEIEYLKLILQKVERHLNLRYEVDKLTTLVEGEPISREMFGKSKKIIRVVNEVEHLSKSEDTTILLEGESGTGKEVFARYIHQQSPRKDKVFIPINCGTIPKDLAESELFGHEKGAFTGASSKTKLGKFEIANNGTILLDEIGELSLDLQVKLLRVLQERKFYRLGGEKEIALNVRVIAATNKNLEEEVKKGNFREDLYYRLNVARIILPPLRERKDDIPILAYSFTNFFSSKFGKNISSIADDAMNLLINQRWSGNVRELRNSIERAMLMAEGKELKAKHLYFLSNSATGDDTDQYLLKIPSDGIKIDVVLRDLILKTLEITNGNQVKAAKVLGLSRSKLRYRMEQLDIEVTKKIG